MPWRYYQWCSAMEGIPGHVAEEGWSKSLQEWLKECNFSFEAEGEATRINIDGVLVEVAEASQGEGYDIVISVQLPSQGSSESASDAELVARAIELAVKVAENRRIRYDLDDSLPDYPMLRAIINFKDPWDLVDAVYKALQNECGRYSQ
jgi:hypothetical protein